MSMAHIYLYQYRHLYFDNFFTSVQLFRDLEVQHTYACGTVRANWVGLPEEIRYPQRLQRGESI